MRRGIGLLIFSAFIVGNAARADDTNLGETRTQAGQGNAKCLVGFSLAERKNLALLP